MKITDISENKKNKNRVSIFIDGRFVTAVFKEIAAIHKLAIGMDMEEEQLLSLVAQDERQKGMQKAYDILSYRARSCGEMREKLREKGFDPEIVTDIIEELEQRKLLDDVEFAADVSANLLERGYGKRAIANKLYQKRISKEIIERVLDELEEEDVFSQALSYGGRIQHKYEGETDCYKQKQKFIQALARHGFSFDMAKDVYEELFREV